MKYKKILLCILDGWGISFKNEYNAIINAYTPCYDSLLKQYPNSLLNASEEYVGLPKGQMGNSEVGHMTLGSGRVIQQQLNKINTAIKDNSIQKNNIITQIIANLVETKKNIHIIGIASDGGVHGHIDHIIYLAQFLAINNINVYLHLIADGRDTTYNSCLSYIAKIKEICNNNKNITIASISGRFYAMDRDNNFERTQVAAKAILFGIANKTNSFLDSIKESYNKEVYDEFLEPLCSTNYEGIHQGDHVIFANYRADRMIQLAKSFIKYNNDKNNVNFKMFSITKYSKELEDQILPIFVKEDINNSLGEIYSQHNLSQLRIAETEKFAHVTYFFNCGKEPPLPLEERCLISSIKTKSYDDHPQMRTNEIKNAIIHGLSENHNLIVANFAAPDMVGHTGNFEAAKKAVEHIDIALKEVTDECLKQDAIFIITADHGNCEIMQDATSGKIHKSHTLNPVPIIIGGNAFSNKIKLNKGSLSDVAPTILALNDIKPPKEMTGKNLINTN